MQTGSRARAHAPAWLIAAASAAVAGCQPAADENAVEQNVTQEPIVNLPVALPARAMDRAALLDAVRDAASAEAAGADDSAAQRELDGRPFEVRIRFGCSGPSADLRNALLGWAFEPKERTLRVRAMPTISGEDPIAAQVAGDAVEAVEGFWLPRPWLIQPVCPAAAAVSPAPAEPAATDEEEAGQATEQAVAGEDGAEEQEVQPSLRWPKVGIAQFFTARDPRTRRRGMRAYETVTTLEPGRPIGSQGYNLVLSGRLRALPGKSAIECIVSDANSPPDCLVSADFDRVWIENPNSREIVAEWGSG